MHKDDKMPKETLGEKMRDKAGEIKEELKEDAEILKPFAVMLDTLQDTVGAVRSMSVSFMVPP